MIEEVITEIREAEQKAEELQKEAYQKGKDVVLAAETEADKQKKQTVADCKANFKAAVAKADAKAREERSAILEKGGKNAEKLVAGKEKEIDAFSDKVLGLLLEKY